MTKIRAISTLAFHLGSVLGSIASEQPKHHDDIVNHSPLITSLRNWLADRPERPHIGDEVERLVDAHRLSGLLYHIEAHLGEPIAQSAKKEWANNTAAYLSRFQALRVHWPTNVNPPLLFKGADYIENLYGVPGARRCVDIDVLVHPSDYDTVLAAFKELPSRPDPYYERLPNDPLYAHGFVVGDNLIEVHRDVGPRHGARLDTHTIYDRSISAQIDGFDVRYPHPDDRLLLWLQNQSKAGFVDGLWSEIDLALILRERAPVKDIEELRELTKQFGLTNAFDLALCRLERHELWPEQLELAARVLPRLAERFCIHPDTPTVMSPNWRRQSLKLWLCPAGKRLSMAKRMVVYGLSRPRSGLE